MMGGKRRIMNTFARKLNDETRFQRIRDLEHCCRLFENAYVMELQGIKTMRLQQNKQKAWEELLEIMFGLLVQEGWVERIEEDEDESADGG